MFAILQKYDFSSKSQLSVGGGSGAGCCLRYCKSTIFQANHNKHHLYSAAAGVVCDTAKVRFFKQITTRVPRTSSCLQLFAILQKYDFSSKSQHSRYREEWRQGCLRYCKSTIFQANHNRCGRAVRRWPVVCDTAKVRFFKQITTPLLVPPWLMCCLRYCKSTIFQANHNCRYHRSLIPQVVCDTAKVRFFKQITTGNQDKRAVSQLFAILQKYDFSSKSQLKIWHNLPYVSCLRYCKSTIFQANHNAASMVAAAKAVVCDTAKVRFFKQITTALHHDALQFGLFAILQKYDFSSKSQRTSWL